MLAPAWAPGAALVALLAGCGGASNTISAPLASPVQDPIACATEQGKARDYKVTNTDPARFVELTRVRAGNAGRNFRDYRQSERLLVELVQKPDKPVTLAVTSTLVVQRITSAGPRTDIEPGAPETKADARAVLDKCAK
ncbi:MAG: hypothetical protein ACOY71_09285 [Gemmatimonadota bacterium]